MLSAFVPCLKDNGEVSKRFWTPWKVAQSIRMKILQHHVLKPVDIGYRYGSQEDLLNLSIYNSKT